MVTTVLAYRLVTACSRRSLAGTAESRSNSATRLFLLLDEAHSISTVRRHGRGVVHLIREQAEALPVQDPVNRLRRHPPVTVSNRRTEQVSLPWRPAQRHQPLREIVLHLRQFSRNDQRTRLTATPEKHQPPRSLTGNSAQLTVAATRGPWSVTDR